MGDSKPRGMANASTLRWVILPGWILIGDLIMLHGSQGQEGDIPA